MSRALEFIRGDTWVIDWAFADADGNPVDLTGAHIAWQMRPGTDRPAVARASTDDGSITVDAPAGTISIRLHYSATEQVAPGYYLCDIQVTYPDDTRESTPPVMAKVRGDITLLDP
jgi:hypothetical protein